MLILLFKRLVEVESCTDSGTKENAATDSGTKAENG